MINQVIGNGATVENIEINVAVALPNPEGVSGERGDGTQLTHLPHECRREGGLGLLRRHDLDSGSVLLWPDKRDYRSYDDRREDKFCNQNLSFSQQQENIQKACFRVVPAFVVREFPLVDNGVVDQNCGEVWAAFHKESFVL